MASSLAAVLSTGLIFYFASLGVDSADGRSVKQLTAHLLKDLNTDEVPNRNLSVSVSLHIYNVFELSHEEVMELNAWATISWTDHRLKWNPIDWGNISSVYISSKKIWTPDIGVINAKQIENKVLTNGDDLRVQVHASGKVTLHSYFISQTPCPVDARMFPFDQQECPLLIGAYFSTEREFLITVDKFVSNVVSSDSVGDWKLRGARSEVAYYNSDTPNYHGKHHDDNTFQYVRVTIVLLRKPLYHIALVLVPYFLISFIAAVLFVLHDPSVRYDMSLNILVALSVYVMIVSQNAPKSMEYLSLLGVFVLVQMGMLVTFTCVVVFCPILFADLAEEDESDQKASSKKRRCIVFLRSKAKWTRRSDYISLIIYMVASFFNALICLVLVPNLVPLKPIN